VDDTLNFCARVQIIAGDYLKRHPDLKAEAFNGGLIETLQRFRSRDDFADDIFLLTIDIK